MSDQTIRNACRERALSPARNRSARAGCAAACLLLLSSSVLAEEARGEVMWRLSCVHDGRTLYLEEFREPPESTYSDHIAGRFASALCMLAPLHDVSVAGRKITVVDEDLDSLGTLDEVEIEQPARDTGVLEDSDLERALLVIFGESEDVSILSDDNGQNDLYGAINIPAGGSPLFSRNTRAGHYLKDNDLFWTLPPGFWLLEQADPLADKRSMEDSDLLWTPPPGYWLLDLEAAENEKVNAPSDNDLFWTPPPRYWLTDRAHGLTGDGSPEKAESSMFTADIDASWTPPMGLWLEQE